MALEQLFEHGLRERVIANLVTSPKLYSQEFSSKVNQTCVFCLNHQMYVMGLINLLRQANIPEVKSRQIKILEAIIQNLQQSANFNPDTKAKINNRKE